MTPQILFLVSLVKITWIDILLSGDNALVIAMVCRGLPPKQRVFGIALGAALAVALRITLTGAAAFALSVPYVKLIGGAALFVIAVKLLKPIDDDDTGAPVAGSLLTAIFLVAFADLTMSIDNIVAVAAAAHGNLILLALGLALSIPMVVAGATVIAAVMDRLPVLTWLGAGLLGWIAGETIAADPVMFPFFDQTILAVSVAYLVIVAGFLWHLYHEHRTIGDLE